MARHSKWHNIKHRKATEDTKRGKIFTLHAQLITLAAQNGGVPNKNPALAEAITKARADNVPNDNIERAIKKGTGEDKNAAQLYEIFYEGYLSGGVGVILKVITDNKNRTANDIRHAFTKYGGNLGETGSVSSFVFSYQGIIYLSGTLSETREEIIIDSGAQEYSEKEESAQEKKIKIHTQKEDLMSVVTFLRDAGEKIISYDHEYIPNNQVEIKDIKKILKIIKFEEHIGENEDVQKIWTNYIIPENLFKEAVEIIEKSRFQC